MTPDIATDALDALDGLVGEDRIGGAPGTEVDRAAAADGPLIEVDDLSLSYGDLSVLSEVSLSVESGEFVGLVGPNGAGKTTLLRAINGVFEPDGGTVHLDGTPVADLGPRGVSRRVATVPQDTSVSFAFTVEDVVRMGRTPYRGRTDLTADEVDREAVDRALERTEMTALRDRPITAVSGGERQRAFVARALAQDTPALVLDEPTASLDINHQIRTLELVREAVDDGKAALAAIHDLNLAARVCDRLVLLSGGAVRATGTPREVLSDDALAASFGVRTAVNDDPAVGSPMVTALREGDDDAR